MTTRSGNLVRATLVACGALGLLTSLATAQQSGNIDQAAKNKLDPALQKQSGKSANKLHNHLNRLPSATIPQGLTVQSNPAQGHSAGGGVVVRGPGITLVDECTDGSIQTVSEGVHAFSTLGLTGTDISSCSFNDSIDGWFLYACTADGILNLSTCGIANYDTVFSVYDVCNGTELACVDDGCNDGALFRTNLFTPVSNGTTYLIRVSGYNGASGDGNLSLAVAPPPDCGTCPMGAVLENEIDCGLFGDTVNGGCNSAPEVYTPIAIGDSFCGTGAFNGSTRDTDWFIFNVPVGTEVTLSVTPEFDALIGFYTLPCPGSGFIDPAAFPTACTTGSVVKCFPPGDYVAFVAPLFGANVACADAAGSRYHGTLTGVPCVPYIPPNDTCATAEVLTPGVVAFGDNTNGDTEATVTSCSFAGAPTTNDVYYTFTPGVGQGGDYRISLCGSVIGDTLLSVHTAPCPADDFSNIIACNDDFCGLQSQLDVTMVEGQQYYIRVASWNANTIGQFQILLDLVPPPAPGDDCSLADIVTSPSVTNGDTSAAQPSGAACVGVAPDWFYAFTPTADGLYTISLCGSGYDTSLAVYTDCTFGTALACNDDFCGLQSEVQVSLSNGVTYFIRVGGFGGGSGPYVLTINDPLPPLGNDDCDDAGVTAASVGVTVGDSSGATTSVTNLVFTQCGTFGLSQGDNDVWHTFTPPSNGVYDIVTCGSAFDTVLAVFSGCPADANSNLVECNDDGPNCGGTFQSEILGLNLSSSTTYFIRVAGYGGATGSYTLTITQQGDPTGACCIGGNCSILTAADCANGGGTYNGDGTSCAVSNYTGEASPNLSIPDNTPAGVTSDIVLAAGQTITDLDVSLFITHTWQGDLSVTLTHVDTGTSASLINRPGQPESTFGFSADNYGDAGNSLPFTLDDAAAQVYDVANVAAPGTLNVNGTWLPDTGPLSVFNGENSAGTWRLSVVDNAGGDLGTLTFWALTVNGGSGSGPCGNPCPEDWDGNDLVEVLDIFAFLTDWFANDPDAQNFGGTPGVPAIFAYLTAWFAHGVGPC